MKKYISKVSELVKHNTGAFLWILFICGGIATLTAYVADKILIKSTGYIYSAGLYFVDFDMSAIRPVTSEVILILLLLLVASSIISAFVKGGFLGYLKRGKQENGEYTEFFFKIALKKWGRMIGATLMQLLMIIILSLVVIIVLAISESILNVMFGGYSLSFAPGIGFEVLVSIIGLLFALIILLLVVSTFIFTYFITFEAALTNGTIGEWISNSFAKARKVFWPLFFWTLLLLVITISIHQMPHFGLLIYYSSYFLFIVFVWYLTAFVFYPLYNLATERWLAGRAEKEKMDEMNKRILESHHKKLTNEENENPDAGGFSE